MQHIVKRLFETFVSRKLVNNLHSFLLVGKAGKDQNSFSTETLCITVPCVFLVGILIGAFVTYCVNSKRRKTSGKNGNVRLKQRLHGTGSVWNKYEIATDKLCVYTEPGGSGTDRNCYLVPNGSTHEGDPIWDRTVPISNRSCVNRVDPISNGSEHIRSRVSVA